MKLTFVILHYQDERVTKDCIQYLQNLNNAKDINIVIVDNNSPNKSGLKLKNKFKDKNNIYVLVNEKNLGFAKGNNIGYNFAKYHLNSDTIVVMNNDILIKDKSFVDILRNLKGTDVHLIAPDIVNLKGMHQNPMRISSLSDKKLKKMYVYNKFLSKIYYVPIIRKLFLSSLTVLKKIKLKKNVKQIEEIKINGNFVPHGSCIIYTQAWIELEDIAFFPESFMYVEEDILFEYIKNKNYKIIYVNQLKVEHLEDAATNMSSINEISKRQFISKHMTKSLALLINMRNRVESNQ